MATSTTNLETAQAHRAENFSCEAGEVSETFDQIDDATHAVQADGFRDVGGSFHELEMHWRHNRRHVDTVARSSAVNDSISQANIPVEEGVTNDASDEPHDANHWVPEAWRSNPGLYDEADRKIMSDLLNSENFFDPASTDFNAVCDSVAAALVPHEGEEAPFPSSARMLLSGVIAALARGECDEPDNDDESEVN